MTEDGIRIEPAETFEQLYVCKGVFASLSFAFRNAKALGIDESSREYAEIARAYWSMPWAEEDHHRALGVLRKCSDRRCKG